MNALGQKKITQLRLKIEVGGNKSTQGVKITRV